MSRRRLPEPPRHQNQYGGLFGNADHTVIYGGNFTSNGGNGDKSGFQILQEHVAAAAFHNSKQRVDPPRCHEHTREAILDDIFEWIVGNVPRKTWIAWLNGAAGSGKSAICQSIAERCILHGILVASFFFFRADSTRNAIDPLVATLAYQIIQLIPETKKHIVETIELNPLIFEQTFEAQIDMLIVRPLRRLKLSDSAWKLLLIIDGVDECDGKDIQMNLVRTMAKLLRGKNLPLIVLFGSRRENQLLMAFNPRNMAGILTQLPLDDNYQAEEDILCFLNDSFDEIKQTHPYRKSLGANWPSMAHVKEIVSKSSGQFIYASVVVNFLSDPLSSPSVRLDIIRGLRPSGRLTPFAQLDALYQHILSQMDDIETTLELLAYVIFGDARRLDIISHFFDFGDADTQSISAQLASVLLCNQRGNRITVTFRHASLPDFLCDEGRSKEYCINTFSTPLSIRWFKMAESGHFKDLSADKQNIDILELLQHAEITDELYASLISYAPSQHHSAYKMSLFPAEFLTVVRNMDFGDDGKAYRSLLNTIVRYVKKEAPREMSDIKEQHDVSQILAQLASEEGANLLSGSESNAEEDGYSNRARAPPVEAASDAHLSGLFRYIDEAPKPLIASQYDSSRKPLRENSTISDSHAIVDVNSPSSRGSLLASTSRPNKWAWVPKIKKWLVKWGRFRAKY